ncbi:MFS transporter [Streptosporangium canum]|uniref:MFS transporter n=1 Tax=Streptosporangium canum TaxID=324952 RepID=UPI0033AC3F64
MKSFSSVVAPLTVRDFRRYYLGQTASAFGDALTPLAIAFAVLHLTGSLVDLGIVVLSTRLPVIVLTLLGGAVGDHFSRRTVMLLTDTIRFMAHGATAVLLLTGTARIWMLVVLQLIAGAGSAFFNPAAVGLVTSLISKECLQEANSLLSISRSMTSIVALGAAGALVAVVGPGWAVLIDALTFLVSAAFLYRLPRTITAERLKRGNGLLASIGGGLAEVGRRSWLWVWIIHVSLTNVIVVSPILVLGPYIADKHLGGAPAWSAIGIGYAAGGLAGGFVSARWKPVRPMVAALLLFLLMAPFPALLALPAAAWCLVLAGIAAGMQLVVYNVLQTTTIQQDLSEDVVSRTMSVATLGSLVAAPLGMGLAGPAAALFGARAVLGAGAVLAVLITVATLLVPSVWRIQGSRAAAKPGEKSAASRVNADAATAETESVR